MEERAVASEELPPNVIVVVVAAVTLLNMVDDLEPNIGAEAAVVKVAGGAESVLVNPLRPDDPNNPPDVVVIEKAEELLDVVEAARLPKRPPLLLDVAVLKENVDGSVGVLSDLAPNKPLDSLVEDPPRLNENPALADSETG